MIINEKLSSILKQQRRHFREFNQKVEENADTIFTILRTHSSYRISRVQILGTIGIKSPRRNMNQPDFNLVVFANYENVPFQDLLDNLLECLVLNGIKYNTEIVMEWRTLSSIYFRMKDVTTSEAHFSRKVSYITFELLPTKNFLSRAEERLGAKNMEETQAERALQLIPQLSTNMKGLTAFQCSLSERYVAFVEHQSYFVHEVILLAKLWNRMVSWNGPQRFRDRTKIIEVVAISVAMKEEKMARKQSRNKSLVYAFDDMLQKFIDFDGLMNEIIQYEANDDLILDLPYQKYVDQTLLSENGPIILDPVNPFNNLAKDIPHYMKETFKAYAKVTRYKLNMLRYQKGKEANNMHELYTSLGIKSSSDK